MLVIRIETYINRQCTYLHFNIEKNAAKLISAYYWRRLQRLQTTAMDQNQLRTLLNGVLEPGELNIAVMNTNLQNAIAAIPAPELRELSLVKVVDFYGKDSKDPHKWLDQFNRAATANQWQDGRLLDIAKGYLKGAAGDWIKAATDVAAANQIVQWTSANAGQNNTSFDVQFIDRFVSETKQIDSIKS